MQVFVLLCLFSTLLLGTTIAQTESCYYFSGTGSWSNTNTTNGKLIKEASMFQPVAGECEKANSCVAFGGYAGGKVMYYTDDTIKSVSLHGVGVRLAAVEMAPAFLPYRRSPYDKTRLNGLGVGVSFYINNTALKISEENERISADDFFSEELDELNEVLDEQLLQLYNPEFLEGKNDEPWETLCGSNYPLCLRKDKIMYWKRGNVVDASNSVIGFADFDFNVFSMQTNYQCTIYLSHGTTCSTSGVPQSLSGYLDSSLIVHYACEEYDEDHNVCSQWVRI